MNKVIGGKGLAYIQARTNKANQPILMVVTILQDNRPIRTGYEVTMVSGAQITIDNTSADIYNWQENSNLNIPSPEEWLEHPFGSAYWKKQ
jgi:hypothetical protein